MMTEAERGDHWHEKWKEENIEASKLKKQVTENLIKLAALETENTLNKIELDKLKRDYERLETCVIASLFLLEKDNGVRRFLAAAIKTKDGVSWDKLI